MLLDRSHAIDLVVVGEGLVVLGDEAEDLPVPEFFQSLESEVPVEQGEQRIAAAPNLLRIDDEWLDQAELANGGKQTEILLPFPELGLDDANRHDLGDRQDHPRGIERHLDVVGHLILPFGRRARPGTGGARSTVPPEAAT